MKTNYTITNYVLASKNIRVVNFLLDLFFINIIFILVYFMAFFIPFNNTYPNFSNWIDTLDGAEGILYKSIICFFYYGLTEHFLSRTLAKYFTKTIVVLKDGKKPNLEAVLARSVLRLIPFECFTFLQGRERGMHDSYSNMFVVNKEKLNQDVMDFVSFVDGENRIK